jgi:putative tryptophan/tyrosine transport system substrate-binding protein
MRRRAFIAGLGSAAAWPVVARGQGAAKVARIGVLWPNPPATFEFLREGLKELGYIDGQKIRYEVRWAEDKLDRLPELARELVDLPVDVLVTLAPPATVAAKNATRSIPIVFVAIGDPVSSGLVVSWP